MGRASILGEVAVDRKRIQLRRSREYYSETGGVWSWRFNVNFTLRPDEVYCLGLDRDGHSLKFVWRLTNDEAAVHAYGTPPFFSTMRKNERKGTYVLRISSGFFLLNPTLETYNRWWGVRTSTFLSLYKDWVGTPFPLPVASPILMPHS